MGHNEVAHEIRQYEVEERRKRIRSIEGVVLKCESDYEYFPASNSETILKISNKNKKPLELSIKGIHRINKGETIKVLYGKFDMKVREYDILSKGVSVYSCTIRNSYLE